MQTTHATPTTSFRPGDHIVYPAHGVGRVMGVVKQCVGRLIALEVHEAEDLAVLDFPRPVVTRQDDPAIDRSGGIEGAGDETHGDQPRSAW